MTCWLLVSLGWFGNIWEADSTGPISGGRGGEEVVLDTVEGVKVRIVRSDSRLPRLAGLCAGAGAGHITELGSQKHTPVTHSGLGGRWAGVARVTRAAARRSHGP